VIYVMGSLRNPKVPEIVRSMRLAGIVDTWAEWFAAGDGADDAWRDYEQSQGRSYIEALDGDAAQHVFEFDFDHLRDADAVVLVAPAGKSAHLELGWALGHGKPGYILLDGEPERWDVMALFATGIFESLSDLIRELQGDA
jgi:hypothetical protein